MYLIDWRDRAYQGIRHWTGAVVAIGAAAKRSW